VRVASSSPLQCVLHTQRERVVGESGADAPHRRAVSEDPVLWRAAYDLVAQRARLWRQPQTGRPLDARDGIAGHAARSAHEHAAPRAPHLPVFTARNGDWRPVRSVVRGHHVHSDASRIHVPRGRHRLVQPLRDRVGRVQQPRERLLRGRPRTRPRRPGPASSTPTKAASSRARNSPGPWPTPGYGSAWTDEAGRSTTCSSNACGAA